MDDTLRQPRTDRNAARTNLRKGNAVVWRGVLTTGIYCRSDCGSRKPHDENIRIFESREAAEAAGFRPCQRCRPHEGSVLDRNRELVAEACRLIDTMDASPSVSALAHGLGISEGHFHRLFRTETGLTPKAYAQGRRAARMRENLARDRRVTETIYDSGFGSSGRFYAVTQRSLGMTPSRYKDGGRNEVLRFAIGDTSLGAILVASSEAGVAAILLGDDPAQLLVDLQDRFPRATLVGGDRDYERLIAEVVGLIEAPGIGTDLPLDIRGTAFQRRVWRVLQNVPAGTTITYHDIARQIGSPRAINAVASACASNALAVAIPCHRVMKREGGAWGYTWGLDRKEELLRREAASNPSGDDP
jgi:AraC family transcriptional regulator, regulatory protein of adaptative response / methylated-DNA-[protein]-cysteine methyltransferase